jgi:hypothetical protein
MSVEVSMRDDRNGIRVSAESFGLSSKGAADPLISAIQQPRGASIPAG